MTSVNNTLQSSGAGLGADATNQAAGSGKKSLSPDDFIKLFLKQLTSQNPLHPADSSTILQQMADISTISASKDTQTALANLQQNVSLMLGNSQFLNATQLIGKRVEIPSGTSPLIKDEGLAGSVMLPGAASNIKVVIKNKDDQVVKELTLDPTSSGGLVDFTWDGLKDDKTACDPGFYTISASATINGQSTDLSKYTLGAFKVQSVSSNHTTGDVILNVDGLGGLGIKDIVKII